MDFKKFASEAGTLFNRAKQFTEEMLGQAEKSELDPELDGLLTKADKTKQWTEKMLRQTESVLQPNPNVRLEEFLYEKVQGKKPTRLTENDVLGQTMIDAGLEFGAGTPYGSTLTKCGQTQQKLGQAHRDFIQATATNFLNPFHSFLEGDMKTIQKERKVLESKRLDLDTAKTKYKKMKSLPAKENESGDLVAKAEIELRMVQSEFDKQQEVTKLLLEGLTSAHAHHLRCLNDFVEAEATFYSQSNLYMTDLQRQLGSFGSVAAQSGVPSTQPFKSNITGNNNNPSANNNNDPNNNNNQQAGFDFNMTELSLKNDDLNYLQ